MSNMKGYFTMSYLKAKANRRRNIGDADLHCKNRGKGLKSGVH